MSPKPQLMAGLELGSRQFTLAVGQLQDRQRLIVRAVGSVPAQGIARGVLTDPMECTDGVARLVRQVERSLSLKVPTVLATVCGNHLKSYNATASIPIPNSEGGITRRDVARAISTCRTLSLDYDRQILHAFPRSFAVDGQSGIKDPVGLFGTKLAIELHLVTALNLGIQNQLRVINRAGLEVEEMILPGLAAAEAVLSELDRDVGVTLIRIGESQTEALLFTEGSIRETFLIPWGTDQLVESISRHFKLPSALAEQLLEQVRGLEERPEWASLSLRVKSGSLVRSFPHAQVAHHVAGKIKEFLGRVRQRLDGSPAYRESTAGVVMVGPFARLEGFLEMAEFLLNMPVRLGIARELELDPQVTLGAAHTTAVGLLRYAAGRRLASPLSSPAAGPLWLRWVERTRHLLEEYF
ncbi:MAG: cell division protein FtsA [Candidatus Omnitrophica bacterium]|nr:cell division protein FtsA [Candidatus Omnitrophota bacterium]